ncbi:hypothetical protein ES703_93956 [subsurface metagenome]
MTKPVNYLTNSLTGLEGEPGIFYNYIMAANGLFIRAKNDHLAATVCIAPAEVRGLAPLEHSVQLLHGKIPMRFVNLALSVFCVKLDIEQYIAVIWQGDYSLRIPDQTQSPGSVTYETLPDTVLDIHSHAGSMPACFSSQDNIDEQGFRIYAVAGDLQNLCPTVALRLGVYGYFLPLDNEEVFV